MPQIIFLLSLFLNFLGPAPTVNVACVGDSITYGAGMANREKNAYPRILQEMLGEAYAVNNFGVNGRTALHRGDYPYTETEAYQQALKSEPDLVFIMLGTNDSKLQNRRHLADLDADYRALIRSFQELKSDPRIVLLLPPAAAFLEDTSSIWDPVIRQQIKPVIQQIAYEEELELIDLYPFFSERPDLMPDKIHPSSLGAARIARRLYETVKMERKLPDLPLRKRLSESGEAFNYHGYQGKKLEINGRESRIVQPKWTAPGNPWVWRARFWGHEPQTDIALLERGFHLVYTDVAGLFGSPEAVRIWDDFYASMVTAGLSERVALEGMSRGGLIIYNWALANPEKVAAIYADAPVLDFKSWPAGKGTGKGSPNDWKKCMAAYGFENEAEALAYLGNPVDQAARLAALEIPLLHVSGLADEVVPFAENTGLLAERIRQQGGAIRTINKEGIGHHPHSLKEPTPIVNFILEAYGMLPNLAIVPQPAAEYRSAAGWPEGCDWHCNHEDINRLLSNSTEVDIVFLGNSITQGTGGQRESVTYQPGQEAFSRAFAKYHWINAGISGDRTEHLLWRLQNGPYREAHPKVMVVTIGVNNFAHNSAAEIADGILAIDRYLTAHLPETRLIISGPLPTGLQPDSEQRKKYEAVHEALAAELPSDHYYPIGKEWLLPSGELHPEFFSKDGIHLARAGYVAWAEALQEIVDQLMK
ncbi:GDSL-type esterase/lipase family protein [Flavilitoribacter nigricans]|uniref:G-D-S-L family lipolytic protein n=1 Tax=Flavilitoribacter nigricans (strain ATCC 23147 / DSM 23189 / NBRC 102662 / NCIMB 1420 / SS-2) TaxID=1122177 RepID=A0A2D0N6C9_FLAN2|nr:GDSL-type esterase/lipase family protein [Flavilitoribacter nigricans]PHN04054.1 G-D-S-L family lipolytic protein [Flavilitoribacter nigricans DSM 23189 = NBRC 102662]